MTLFPRSSGILLHPTSLPGKYGIGDLGKHAYQFVDWLYEAGQTIWQVLPLGPTSYGDSPYQCLSAFAGNTNLISLDKLVEDGWLTPQTLADVPDFPVNNVDYGPVINYHNNKLHLAYMRFKSSATDEQRAALDVWCKDEAHWLDDWSLFFALKNEHGGRPWVEWEVGLALRDEDALQAARLRLADEINKHRFLQWLFHEQWYALKAYANQRNIRLIGDIPIFVAHDSADVWSNRGEYYLDPKGNPEVIAGVPPDYFSPTGQRWGNPLYRWDMMAANGYRWWIQRFETVLKQVDMVRVDHFRGFEAYWEIPASEETAINGEWVAGPRARFFESLEIALGKLPIIAEDLGVITEGVVNLRDKFGLPGMKVLQFAWSDPENPFLPHNHVANSVVYSGTHDNNTTVGWWNDEVDDQTRSFMSQYLDRGIQDPAWAFMQLGMRSVAHTFIMTLQDVFSLGVDSRMNTPGKETGNWGWRISANALGDDGVRNRLAHVTWLYQRRSDQQEIKYGDVAVKD
jgi:4-alpha-glucanotransferase